MTVREYLEFEAAADTKHEFVNGELVATAGTSPEHGAVTASLGNVVMNALRAANRPCITFTSDTRVRISETGLYAYPDLTVACGKPAFDEESPPSLLNPLVLFEVLSPSTEAWDRGAKFAHYKTRESLREYVIVSATERKVEVFRRGESGWWATKSFEDDTAVPLESLGIEVPLTEIYEQLRFLT